MKKFFLIISITAVTSKVKSQTFNEWLRQKETRIKLMLQQIAANQIYIDYLQKGYAVAMNGLQTIHEIKHGDFHLHKDFFDAMALVNPKIRNLAKLADIMLLQVQIIKNAASAMRSLQSSSQFSPSEISYMQNVCNRLWQQCIIDISELITLVSDGALVMSDDERINRIDGLYSDMQEKLSFSKSFFSEAFMLSIQRGSEKTDIDVSRKLNGIQ